MIGEDGYYYDFVSTGYLGGPKVYWIATTAKLVNTNDIKDLVIWHLTKDGSISDSKIYSVDIIGNGVIKIKDVYVNHNNDFIILSESINSGIAIGELSQDGKYKALVKLAGKSASEHYNSMIITTKNNEYIVAGTKNKSAFIKALRANGELLWKHEVRNNTFNTVLDYEVTNDGNIVVLGGGGSGENVFSAISHLWLKIINMDGDVTAEYVLQGVSGNLALSQGNKPVVVYDKDASIRQEVWLSLFDSNLSPLFSKHVSSAESMGSLLSVENTSRGNYMVLGSKLTKLWAICVDASADIVWDFTSTLGKGLSHEHIAGDASQIIASHVISWNKELDLNYKLRFSEVNGC